MDDEEALATARTKRALSMIALQLTTIYQRIVGKAYRTLVKFSADSSKAQLEEEHAQALNFGKPKSLPQAARERRRIKTAQGILTGCCDARSPG